MIQSEYNLRLFQGNLLRRTIHYSRFHWVAKEIKQRGLGNYILELGCFDGKVLDFLEKKPIYYLGLDANWENGLSMAKEKYKCRLELSFEECLNPSDMEKFLKNTNRPFDTAICMETLEHIPAADIDQYLRLIASHLVGYFFITVPNEKGALFVLKRLTKKILRMKDNEKYTFREFINAAIGRMDKVARNQHKGFDYDSLIRDDLAKHFDIVKVQGIPFRYLPVQFSPTIGIVAKTKETLI